MLGMSLLFSPAYAGDAPLTIDGARTVDADGVIGLISAEPELVILDNRKIEDFNAGAIEGATRLIDTEMSAETLAKSVPTKATALLFYCNGLKCGRAANAVKMATGWGYSKVSYYALGMDDWVKKGLPVVKH
ncbi:rhodanese-like domain-containing protein [uncultured Methylobacterium sp.]|uniref:rhodanese-like domain-containing protein n=1 Tax=uncultured Methylobacterium sp. TaxID=157278 RepID=UPI0035CB98B2